MIKVLILNANNLIIFCTKNMYVKLRKITKYFVKPQSKTTTVNEKFLFENYYIKYNNVKFEEKLLVNNSR